MKKAIGRLFKKVRWPIAFLEKEKISLKIHFVAFRSTNLAK